MKRVSRFGVFVILGLLVMVISINPAAGQPSQATSPDHNKQLADSQAANPEGELNAAGVSLHIPGSAFKPMANSGITWNVKENHEGCVYVENGDPSIIWHAPIYPPQGATLNSLTFYVYDASAQNTWVALNVLDGYGTTVSARSATSSGASGYTYAYITLDDIVVDYTLQSYELRWMPTQAGGNLAICGVRLTYIPAGGIAYLPAIFHGSP